jgi:FkbM family methyltransferase
LNAELERTRQRLARLRAKLEVTRQRLRLLEQANRRRARVQVKLRAARQRLSSLGVSRRRARARRLREAVLAQVMPLRHRALLAANPAERCARDTAFLERSASYCRARRSNELPAGSTSLELCSLTWWIPPSSDATRGPTGLILGKERLPLREILDSRELAVGGIMLDIGANIGTTSIPRVVLGDFDRVYAAEPDPDNYACLVRNVVDNRLHGLVLPDRLALGDTVGDVSLARRSTGTHHIIGTPDADAGSVRVRCSTLDAWVAQLSVDLSRVTFVKSDTQGWDVRVLLGAREVLCHKHIAWQIEFSPAMLQRAGCTLAVAYDVIRTHFTHFIDMRGTTGTRVRRTCDLPKALEDVERGHRGYTNLLLYNAAA